MSVNRRPLGTYTFVSSASGGPAPRAAAEAQAATEVEADATRGAPADERIVAEAPDVLTKEGVAAKVEAAADGGTPEIEGSLGVPTKRVPNPWGMKGNPHYYGRLVQEIASDIDPRRLDVRKDYPVRNSAGDIVRRVDVAGLRNGVPVEFHQVGLVTRAGNPIAREWDALLDVYDLSRLWPEFHPYGISW